jgi:hypothetical protein
MAKSIEVKTAEEILESHLTSMLSRTKDSYVSIDEMKQVPEWGACVNAIEQAQKEAYNQALEDATEKAKVSLFDWINNGFKEFKQNSNHYSINDGTYVKIDEQSILKLKK